VLEVEDLVVYRGRRLVVGVQGDEGVKGLSFVLRRGELAVLQAPNGWGKTTLLEAIAGSLPIAAGEIKVNGRSVRKFESWQRVRSGMALLQSQHNVFAGLQVREGLRLAKVREVPAELRFFLGRRVSELSGGERQRVAIACAIRGRPFAVGLLDEPFSALDPKAVEQLRSLQIEQLDRVGWLVSVPMGAATIL
jgi:ABC-type multidrug transport system ATPase subunit